MRKILMTSIAVASLAILAVAPASASSDADSIRGVIQSAYVDGLHMNGDRDAIRAGFHPDFVMTIRGNDGGVRKVTIEEWIGRLPDPSERPEATTTAEIPQVDVVGDTAVARVEVYRDGEHVFTDFMGLYRFDEGWRIVAKIFQSH